MDNDIVDGILSLSAAEISALVLQLGNISDYEVIAYIEELRESHDLEAFKSNFYDFEMKKVYKALQKSKN